MLYFNLLNTIFTHYFIKYLQIYLFFMKILAYFALQFISRDGAVGSSLGSNIVKL
jgi:hypothetical protein